MSDDVVTDEEFRQSGYTGAARNFPLTQDAFEWKCRVWNGVDPAKAPRAWRFAPNDYMRKWTEQQAAAGAKR